MQLRLPPRDELLAVELFSWLAEAKVLIEDCRQDYNHHRPHSSLQMMTPVAFASSLRGPLLGPTATAAGEGSSSAPCWPTLAAIQGSLFQSGEQQSPAEEITRTSSQPISHSIYRGAATATTQLSQQVGR